MINPITSLIQVINPLMPADTTGGGAAAVANPAEELKLLKNLSLEDLIDKLARTIVDFAIHLGIAILVFYVGKFAIKRLYNLIAGIMVSRRVDRSLSTFILSLVNMVLYFILIVIVIGIIGIPTSSFIALFASAGVAIGMALSGTLQNFAGGVLILLLKPYKVGDYIETQGYAGTVTEIQIFSTIICTYDNKSIIIPNGGLSTGSINNWSREDYRRIDWNVSLSYGDDVDRARQEIISMLAEDPRIVQTTIADDRSQRAEALEAARTETAPDQTEEEKPRGWVYRLFHRHKRRLRQRIEAAQTADETNPLYEAAMKTDRRPQVLLSAMADSSIQVTVRAWVRSSDYWPTFYEINELLYRELPRRGFTFPFPQLDVHLPA